MKRVFILMAIALSFCAFDRIQAQTDYIDLSTEKEEPIYTICEEAASYPGGVEELQGFMASNIKYPQQAIENGIEGTLHITFVVEKDGSLSNIKVLHDIGYGCAEELVRVVKLMPKWNPAKQKGEVVRGQFNLPFKFVLPKE